MTNPLTLINAFEVPQEADEQFVSAWDAARTALQDQPGYGGAALHRSIAPMTPYRFINIGHWESLDAFTGATQSAGVSAQDFPFPAHPGLYDVIASTERLTSNGGDVVLINLFEVDPQDDEPFIQLGTSQRVPPPAAGLPEHPPSPQRPADSGLPVRQRRALDKRRGVPGRDRRSRLPRGRRLLTPRPPRSVHDRRVEPTWITKGVPP